MKIKRAELYRRVWETPIRTLAKEFDISDVGLAKACRKHAIPLPPVGYWTKVQHGKPVSKPPLPRGDDVDVVLDASRFRLPPLPEAVAELKRTRLTIRPPVTTEHLALFAAATFKRLSKAKSDGRGMVSCHGADVFSCEVSPASVERAARLLHTIELALPEIGAQLNKSPKENCVQVERGGVSVTFKLFEKCTSTFEVLKDPKYSWNDRKIYTYTMTGQLALHVEGYFDGQKSWADGKRDNLDDKLADFVTGLAAAIESIRARDEERARQRARWEEEARIREEMERKRRKEEELRAQLLKEATAWRDAELCIEYLKHIKARLGDASTLPAAAQEWLLQAEQVLATSSLIDRRVQVLRTAIDSPS